MGKGDRIELGDKVKDPVTGYTGIAYCRTHFLQGCDRIGIQAPMIKGDNNNVSQVPELYTVDEPQLIIVNKAKEDVKKKPRKLPGGPSRFVSYKK